MFRHKNSFAFNAVMRVVKNDFHGKPEEFLDHPIVARLAGMVFMLSCPPSQSGWAFLLTIFKTIIS